MIEWIGWWWFDYDWDVGGFVVVVGEIDWCWGFGCVVDFGEYDVCLFLIFLVDVVIMGNGELDCIDVCEIGGIEGMLCVDLGCYLLI